jgi:hypothetical protein
MLLPLRATGKDWCEFSSIKKGVSAGCGAGVLAEAGVAAVPTDAAIVKICRSFVSGFQKNPARCHGVQQKVGEKP